MSFNVFESKGRLPWWEFALIMLFIAYYTQYEFQEVYRFQVTFIGTAYCFFLAFWKKDESKAIICGLFLILFITLCFLILTDTATIGNVSNRGIKIFVSKYSQFFQMSFPAVLFIRTMKCASINQIKAFVFSGLLLCVLVSYSALKLTEIDPEILHQTDASFAAELGFNIAGYYFIYSFCFIAITCLVIFKSVKNKLVRSFSLLLIAFSIYFLFKSQFSLSIVTTAISCFYFFFKFAKSQSTRLVLVFSCFVFILLAPAVFNTISNISSGMLIKERMSEMSQFFTTGKSNKESDLGIRLDLYWRSIKAFVSSPIWGNRHVDFDGHATWLTVPCDLGIIGAYPLYKLMTGCGQLISKYSQRYAAYMKPLFCQILLMGFTNPVHSAPSNFIMLWYLCPLAIILFLRQEKTYE